MASNPGPSASAGDATSRVRPRTWAPTALTHRDKPPTKVAATAQTMCLWRLGQPEAHRQSPCKDASAGGNAGSHDKATSSITPSEQ